MPQGTFHLSEPYQPDHFRRNDNLTFNQNYPSRSINFKIVYRDGFSAKTHRKASFIVEMTVPAMVRLPWVPEAFCVRFPVSVKSKLREAPRRTREETSGTQGMVRPATQLSPLESAFSTVPNDD